MCDSHRATIGHAMDQLRVTSYAMAAVPQGSDDVANVVFELGMLQLHVSILARARQRNLSFLVLFLFSDSCHCCRPVFLRRLLSPRWTSRPILILCCRGPRWVMLRSPQKDVVEKDQPGKVPGISAGDILALGHCYFLVSDCLQQLKARNSDPVISPPSLCDLRCACVSA